MSPITNPQEDAARALKATRLADVLASHGATATSVLDLPEAGWDLARDLAEEKFRCRMGRPSEQTRLLVATILRLREKREAIR